MGRRIRSTSIDYGRNPDVFVPSDRAYVRCNRCGFICNTTRDSRSDEGSRIGYGIDYQNLALAFSSTIGFSTSISFNGATDTYDPIVVGGCPQCGCMLYDK